MVSTISDGLLMYLGRFLRALGMQVRFWAHNRHPICISQVSSAAWRISLPGPSLVDSARSKSSCFHRFMIGATVKGCTCNWTWRPIWFQSQYIVIVKGCTRSWTYRPMCFQDQYKYQYIYIFRFICTILLRKIRLKLGRTLPAALKKGSKGLQFYQGKSTQKFFTCGATKDAIQRAKILSRKISLKST